MKKSKLVQDKNYSEMYRIKWPDGKISDMVNKTRAKDAILRFNETEGRKERGRGGNGPTEPVGEFKSFSGTGVAS